MNEWVCFGNIQIDIDNIDYFEDWGTWNDGDSVKCMKSQINVILKSGKTLSFIKRHWMESDENEAYDELKAYKESLLTA